MLDTYENAVDFARWVTEDFAIDGALFLNRPRFAEVTAQVGRVFDRTSGVFTTWGSR